MAEGRETSATGAFRPLLDGRRLSFAAEEDEFGDEETGSRWNILGETVEGELEGEKLASSTTSIRSGSRGWPSRPRQGS